MPPRYSTEQFIEKSIAKHGFKYSYSKTVYKGISEQVIITCSTHGDFKQKARDHLAGCGCQKCANNYSEAAPPLSFSLFKQLANKTYSNKYLYRKSNELNKVFVTCKEHNCTSLVLMRTHLNKVCCQKCAYKNRGQGGGGKKRLSSREFVCLAKQLHGLRYSYSKVNSEQDGLTVCITCKQHGDFWQNMSYHLRGHGCPECYTRNSSEISIIWIEKEAKARRLKNVIHGGNGKEYTIPGTRIRVDGYHKQTNTVFEFHGDAFHGNPNVYKPRTKPHPFSNKTAKQLHKETIERELRLANLGYKLVIIWESDFKNGLRYSKLINF